jgi:AcrR family transcriptional regulator
MKKTAKKDQILAAAIELFAQKGFEGTSMADIAQLADVNHSLIFHYFGNKEKLWIAVKQVIALGAQEREPVLPPTDVPFNEFLSVLFVRALLFYQNNPKLVRMINWQRLEPAKNRNIGMTESEGMKAWMDAFKMYQMQGDIDKSIRLEFLITMILSVISSAALDPNVYISTKESKDAYIDFCVESILKVACR